MERPEDDRQLLDRYLARNDERAFRELVARHLSLVHGVACRVTASDDLAKDVAQNAFVQLARRAASIPGHVPVVAWLHRTTRSLAINLVRSESSRKKRESRMALQSPATECSPEPQWGALAPVVDELIDHLPAADRDAILLRYYSNESHGAIGMRLGLSEEAARKRTARALEKLRMLLKKQGILTSSSALATLLPANAAVPVSDGFLTQVLGAAHGVAPMSSGYAAFLSMNAAQKTSIALAALVFLSAAGYSIRPAKPLIHVSPGPPGHSSAVMGEHSERTGRTKSIRSLPETRQERLDRLREIMAMENAPARIREFIAYVEQLPAELFGETSADLWPLVFMNGRPAEQDYFLGAWTRVDPEAAATFTLGQRDGLSSASRVLRTWASLDASAALTWVEANRQGEGFNYLQIPLLAETGVREPERLAKFIEALPDERDRSIAMSILQSATSDQADLAERLMPFITSADVRRSLLSRMVHEQDPGTLFKRVKDDPEMAAAHVPQNLFRLWVEADESAARAALDGLPSGPVRDRALMGAISGYAGFDPSSAFDLIRGYPQVDDGYQVEGILHRYWGADPELMLKNIDLLDAGEREKFLAGHLPAWQQKDPAAANRWIQSTELPASVRKKLLPP